MEKIFKLLVVFTLFVTAFSITQSQLRSEIINSKLIDKVKQTENKVDSDKRIKSSVSYPAINTQNPKQQNLFNKVFPQLPMSTDWSVTIGSGSTTSFVLPSSTFSKFSYSQQIYTQLQIATPGEIIKIRFKLSSFMGYYSNNKSWTVYLGHTTKTTFSTTEDWVPLSSMTQVFSGLVTFPLTPGDWLEITLSNPFYYNNIDNLVVAVDENTIGEGTPTSRWFSFTSGTNTGIYYYNNSNNPDPSSPPVAVGRTDNINQLQLEMIAIIPTVITSDISNITTNSATSGGEITSTGGEDPSQRGVCWSTSINPTISDAKTQDGPGGLGLYTSNISGLTTSTTYYVRAYATNSVGTSYGSNITFNTLPPVTVTGAHSSSNGTYTTLKLAFDAINAQNQTGNNIVITITASTTEASTATLNAGAWNTLNIYPTSSGLSISGSFTGTLIELNGADNVTIDGRVNQAGNKDLIIQHNISGNNNSTIRFINSAENNTIHYCIIKGCCQSYEAGVIFFSTSTAGNGNDNNVIYKCDITNGGTRPVNCVYSYGTSGSENGGNVIANNNFFDHFSTYKLILGFYPTSGIYVDRYSNNFNISDNSFFETTTLTATEGNEGNPFLYFIYVTEHSGGGYNITGNYIGGQSAQCGGNAFTTINFAGFNGIVADGGATASGNKSNIINNTIKNIDVTSYSSVAAFIGINIRTAYVENCNGNVIGDSTGNGSIKVKSSENGTSIGINYITPSMTYRTRYISNNVIGGITLENTSSYKSYSFYGIYSITDPNNTFHVIYWDNNLIGSTSTPNSIQLTSTITSELCEQQVCGIYCAEQGTNYIRNNTVANLTNLGNTPNKLNRCYGILTTNMGNFEINNNTIRDLKNANPNIDIGENASVFGIANTSTGTTKQNIFGNTIYNLENTRSTNFAVNVTGICYQGPDQASTSNIYNNFVHSLKINSDNTSTTAVISGIEINNAAFQAGGTSVIRNIYNNIVSIGNSVNNNCKIYGISEMKTADRTNNVYFNTVYLAGSPNGDIKTKALYINGSTGAIRNIRNNIFVNARSRTGGTGKHYAAFFGNITGLTVDFNDYYTPGTGGILGYYSEDKNSLPIVVGQDANSLNINPEFQNAGGKNDMDYMHQTSLSGTSINGYTKDYFYVARANPPTMGAFERSNTQYKVWVGWTSTDFANKNNWLDGTVPAEDANIVFSSSASNNCVLDGNRSINTLVNSTEYNLVTGNNQLTIKGSINNKGSGKIDAYGSSTIVFNGSTEQTIPYNAFVNDKLSNLTINNSAGVTLGGAITVTNGITLTSGLLTLGENNLTYSGTNAIGGSPTSSNMIVATGSGELRKTFTGIGSFTFPVGDNDLTAEYSPVTLNFTAGTFLSAYVGVKLKNDDYIIYVTPNYLKRYWVVKSSGITSFACDITLKYNDPADIVGTEALISLFSKRTYPLYGWNVIGAINTIDNQLEATGVTYFDIYVGQMQLALSVKLSSFNASVNNRDAKLNWITESEENNSGFEIHRTMMNGTSEGEWNKIGFVKGNGTKTTASEYSFRETKLSTGKYKYRLKQIDYNGNYEFFELDGQVEVGIPNKFDLSQNYPNPFNPETKIDFDLPEDGKVSIKVFDITGRQVMNLLNEFKTAGYYIVTVNAGSLSSGVYFYRMTSENNKFVMTKKMVLIK